MCEGQVTFIQAYSYNWPFEGSHKVEVEVKMSLTPLM